MLLPFIVMSLHVAVVMVTGKYVINVFWTSTLIELDRAMLKIYDCQTESQDIVHVHMSIFMHVMSYQLCTFVSGAFYQ